jgi:hypothetical protein
MQSGASSSPGDRDEGGGGGGGIIGAGGTSNRAPSPPPEGDTSMLGAETEASGHAPVAPRGAAFAGSSGVNSSGVGTGVESMAATADPTRIHLPKGGSLVGEQMALDTITFPTRLDGPSEPGRVRPTGW